MDPFEMKKLTREQIHKLVLTRFGAYLENPDREPDDPFDLKSAINDDTPGRRYEAWHMIEFAKIDDLKANGFEIKEACKRVRRQLLGHVEYSGDDTSFRNMYYEFKRKHENFVRRRAFAYSIFNNNIDEAEEQCFRLSKITDVTKEFRYWYLTCMDE
jgi:hypothetical protein